MKHSRKSAQGHYRHPLVSVLSPILSEAVFQVEALPDPGPGGTARRWPPLMLVWTALLMAWSDAGSLGERFAEARSVMAALFPFRRRVGKTYQGLVKALAVSGSALLDRLAEVLREHVRSMSSCGTVLGIEAFAVDGSRVECPRTEANQAVLKRAGRNKTGPQLSLTTLYHLGSGCPWDYRLGPGTDSERTHLREMLATLPPGATIVADAGFIGYELLKDILASGRHILFRVGSNVTLLKELGYARVVEDSTVCLWPDQAQKRNQPPLVLRLMVVPGAHPVYLVTDVLSETALSFEQAGALYRRRWGVEVFYRSLKQTLGRRKMRSGAPDNVQMELAWSLVGLWVLSVVLVQAATAEGKEPGKVSIAQARDVLRRAMGGHCRTNANLRRQLAGAVQDHYVRSRPKAARNWPHKKNDRPPGAPKIRSANAKEIQRAKQLSENAVAA